LFGVDVGAGVGGVVQEMGVLVDVSSAGGSA